MSAYRRTNPDECLSWSELIRAVDEGRMISADHLRHCDACRERGEFLAALSVAVAGRDSAAVVGACPNESDWAALADEGVSRQTRMDMVEHLLICEQCSSLWRHLVGIRGIDETDWEVRESPVAPGGDERRTGFAQPHARFFRWMGPALAVVATVVVLIVLLARPFPPIDSGDDARWRGPVAQLSVDLDWEVPGGPPTLRWEALSGATSYRVRLWDATGEQIVDHQLRSEPSPHFPIELPGVLSGQLIIWQVDALDAGRAFASAGPTEFRWRVR